MKKHKLGLFILNGCIFLALFSLSAMEDKCVHQKEMAESAFLTGMNERISETISNTQEIPGLKSEEFAALRADIAKTWSKLFKDGVLEVCGTDRDFRPNFVALQGIIEHVLASELQKSATKLIGIIHTPMPATPLCTKGEISKELVDPSIEIDPARSFTVKARTTIVRDYLFKGGDLFIIYPKDGLNKRTEEQQKIYKQELVNFPEHLFDVQIESESIPTELIGATYLFQDQFGNKFAFAIKMTQAKDPQEQGSFGLWFSQVEHPAVKERLQAVDYFIKLNKVNVLNNY